VGERRRNAKFRTFYWKSRGETNSMWPKKVSGIIELFFGDSFFQMFARKLIGIIFKIKENMIAVLRG
jgi:hypothetical protein